MIMMMIIIIIIQTREGTRQELIFTVRILSVYDKRQVVRCSLVIYWSAWQKHNTIKSSKIKII
jgi:hypothetical protein